VLHSYSYDGAGHLTQDVANGGLTTTNYTWDAATRLTSATVAPAGPNRVTTYGYNADNDITSVVKTGVGSSGSQETDFGYNSGNYETSQTVKNGRQNLVTTYAVDELGQVTAITDPRGNVSGGTPANYTTTMAYDPAGDVQTITEPSVQVSANGSAPAAAQPVMAYGYDTFGDRAQVRDPLGNVTSNGYDGDGRQTSRHEPSYTPPGGSAINPVTTTTYDGNGNVLTTTNADGTTTSAYDQLGDLVKITNPPVNSVAGAWTYAYDTDGERTAAVSPTGAQTQATYDSLGHQITSTQVERYASSAAYVTTMAYDNAGNLVSTSDPLGNTTTSAYDAASELTTSTDPSRNVTTYGYDGFGDQLKITNPLGDTTSTTYDQAGRITGVTRANAAGTLTATASYGYDPAGTRRRAPTLTDSRPRRPTTRRTT
jgi:YD repeat-containing protein